LPSAASTWGATDAGGELELGGAGVPPGGLCRRRSKAS
jgi:hypothetical protein